MNLRSEIVAIRSQVKYQAALKITISDNHTLDEGSLPYKISLLVSVEYQKPGIKFNTVKNIESG